MSRPTAMIRDYLLLQILETKVSQALVQARRDLVEADVKIVEVVPGKVSTDVTYVAEGRSGEGYYLNAVLEAAAQYHLKHMPDVKRFLQMGDHREN